MRKVTLLVLALAAASTASCSDGISTTSLTTLSATDAQLAKGTSLPTVSLVVTITDADSAGVEYGIRSDGLGAYIDGSQNVQAVLDQYGTFAFNTDNSPRPATRWVTYDFSHPVDPANNYRPNPSNSRNYHFSTGPSALSAFTALQNLGVGSNPTSECMYMGNGITNGTSDWAVSYHKGQEDVVGTPTAFVMATRVSVTPAVWTLTPVGSCSPNSNVASLRSGDGRTLYGYYTIPFHFTLRAK